MGSKGFQVEYKILDKTPIGVCYSLIMLYQENTEHRGDVLLLSMHVPCEMFSVSENFFAQYRNKYSTDFSNIQYYIYPQF